MPNKDRIAEYLDKFSEQEPEELLPHMTLILKTWIQAAQINALVILDTIKDTPSDTDSVQAHVDEVIAVNDRMDDMLSAVLQYVAGLENDTKTLASAQAGKVNSPSEAEVS